MQTVRTGTESVQRVFIHMFHLTKREAKGFKVVPAHCNVISMLFIVDLYNYLEMQLK